MKRIILAIMMGVLMIPVMLLGFLFYTVRLYFESGLEQGEMFKNWMEAGVDDFYDARKSKERT